MRHYLLFITGVLSCDSDPRDPCKDWSPCDLRKDWSRGVQEANFCDMTIVLYGDKSGLAAINLYIFSLKISTHPLSSNSHAYMGVRYLFSDSVLYFCSFYIYLERHLPDENNDFMAVFTAAKSLF